jgi:hypothetical protein
VKRELGGRGLRADYARHAVDKGQSRNKNGKERREGISDLYFS